MISKPIKTPWLQGVKDQDKPQVVQSLRAYLELSNTKKLIEILVKREKQLDSPVDYTNPNWAFETAHRNGQRQMLKEIRNLLNE